MKPIAILPALAVLLSPLAAHAQTTDSTGARTYSLTPEEKEKALDVGTDASVDRADPPGGEAGRQIHGEVGAMIGTGGTRGAYGVAAIPLSERAGAVVSFESSRFGHDRGR